MNLHSQDYRLTAATLKLVGKNDASLLDKLSYNVLKQEYIFNQGALGRMANPKNSDQALMATKTGSGSPLYSLDIPTDPTKGITYHDSNTGLAFTIVSNFAVRHGQQEQGHLVYPLNNYEQEIYTLKNNGLKEDIAVTQANSDQLAFAYQLRLPKTLEARMIKGSDDVGIYSADASLYSNIINSYSATSSNQTADMQARINEPKTNLVFGIPAPTITTIGKNSSNTHVHYMLQGDSLILVASGLKSIHGPFSIDPSVVVNSTASFMAGNNEDNIAFGSNQVSREGLTGGGLSSSWAAGGSLQVATETAGVAAYNSYMYVIAGNTGSNTDEVEYTQIGSGGTYSAPTTCTNYSGWAVSGSWCYDANSLPQSGGLSGGVSAAYNGYLYYMGGKTSTSDTANVYYTKLNSDGSLVGWNTLNNNLPLIMDSASSVAYDNYVYILGGNQNGSTSATVYYAQYDAMGGLLTNLTNCSNGGTLYNNTWCSTTALLAPLANAVDEVYNGYIYEMGGSNGTTNQSAVQYAPINNNGSIGSWVSSTALPTASSNSMGGVFDGYLYYMAGGSASVYYISIYANGGLGNAWTATTVLPASNTYESGIAYNGYIYVVGGNTGSITANVDYAAINPAGLIGPPVATTDQPSCAKIKGSSYYTLSAASEVYNGYIYYVGGIYEQRIVGAGYNSYDTACAYVAPINSDGTVGAWSTTTSLPETMDSAGSFVYNGYIYILGGNSGCNGTSGCILVATSYYAPISTSGTIGTWSTTTSLPSANDNTAVQYDGYAYDQIGLNVYYATINSNGTLGTWSSPSVIPGGVQSNLIIYGGYAYILSNDSAHDIYYAPVCTNTNNGVGGCTGSIAALGTWSLTGAFSGNTNNTTSLLVNNGYIYTFSSSYSINDAPIGSSGSIGNWVASSSTVPATAGNPSVDLYNGDAYIYGANYDVNADTTVAVGYYAPLNNGGPGTMGAWASSTALPIATMDATSIAHNGYVYEIGGSASGSTVKTVAYAALSFAGGLSTMAAGNCPSGWTLDSTSTWCSNTTSLPSPAYLATSVVYDGYIYEIGGCATNPCSTPTSAVYYALINANGSLGNWSAAVNLPVALTSATSVTYKGYIYEIGGYNGSANVNTISYAVLKTSGGLSNQSSCPSGWTLDVSNTWCSSSSSGNLPVATAAANSAVANGYIYELGGNSQAVYYAPINANGSLGNWSAAVNLPAANSYATSAIYDGYLYELGGTGGQAVYYAPINSYGGTGPWNITTSLPISISNATSVVGNGYVYQFGGSGTAGTTDYYAALQVMPHIAHYSKLIDFGTAQAVAENISYTGNLPDDQSGIAIRIANSNGALGNTQYATTLSLPTSSVNCVTGFAGYEYIWVDFTMDDSASATFPDSSGADANVTSFTINYAPGRHPAPNLRLRGGMSFYNSTLQPLDTCTP